MNILGFIVNQSPDELVANKNTFFPMYVFGIDGDDAMGLCRFVLARLASGRLAWLLLFLLAFLLGRVGRFVALGTVIETKLRRLGRFAFGVLLESLLQQSVFNFECRILRFKFVDPVFELFDFAKEMGYVHDDEKYNNQTESSQVQHRKNRQVQGNFQDYVDNTLGLIVTRDEYSYIELFEVPTGEQQNSPVGSQENDNMV